MKPNRAAKVAAVLLAIFGVAALVAAGLVATNEFKVRVGRPARTYSCGSVIVSKDPRNLIGNRAQVPRRLRTAAARCQSLSNSRTTTVTRFLLVGMIPLLIVLTLPAISRRSRRARRRHM
jgi:hypothetical protein